jgi:hypothetical protein
VCTDEDSKRSFLLDHIERVIYDHYEVTIIGSVPVQTTTGTSKLRAGCGNLHRTISGVSA